MMNVKCLGKKLGLRNSAKKYNFSLSWILQGYKTPLTWGMNKKDLVKATPYTVLHIIFILYKPLVDPWCPVVQGNTIPVSETTPMSSTCLQRSNHFLMINVCLQQTVDTGSDLDTPLVLLNVLFYSWQITNSRSVMLWTQLCDRAELHEGKWDGCVNSSSVAC